MLKPALGKRLGSLLRGGTHTQRDSQEGGGSDNTQQVLLGRGMRTLIDSSGANSSRTIHDECATNRHPSPKFQLPRWYLLAADLVLLVVAASIVHQTDHLGLERWVVIGGIVVSGAACALMAAIRPLPMDDNGGDPLDDWTVLRDGSGGTERIVMVHRVGLAFACEIKQIPGGRIEVVPISAEPNSNLTAKEIHRLTLEAANTFRKLEATRATRLRSSLGSF